MWSSLTLWQRSTMPSISADDLRERLRRDMPGALVEQSAPAAPADDGAINGAPHKGTAQRSLLATNDVVVAAQRLPDVARYMRDQLGYALLSNITAVDYLADGIIELVYHFVNMAGGPPLVVKVRVPRERAVVPSLTPFWPGADFQEREAFDLFGVEFPGHPDLRRIYMWDEFEGFPMRKDFPKQGDKYMEDE